MRTITEHLNSDQDGGLKIWADETFTGYLIEGYTPGGELSACAPIAFQVGPVGQDGPNGVTEECLLAIMLDRLRAIQKSTAASVANQAAIHNLEKALRWIKNGRAAASIKMEATSGGDDGAQGHHPLFPIANAYRAWLAESGEPFGQDSYDRFRREVWKDEHAPLMVQSLPWQGPKPCP